jgi:cyclopropane-fatty-acyl-phospholipid synthase
MDTSVALPSSLSAAVGLHRPAAHLILKQIARLQVGSLGIELPDGRRLRFGDATSAPHVELRVRRWRFFRRLLAAADIGLGESYMDGDWECGDVAALCSLFVLNREPLASGLGWTRLLHAGDRLRALLRPNTRRGSRRNIAYHYDLSNELYRLFLDPSTMAYSCATYADPGATLDAAQEEKIDGICRRLELQPGMAVLEIGSGWGGFAIHAARRYGARVTSITLSRQQLELARRRAAEAGVTELVELRLCDYRDVRGQFDRIVSIEMFEAVGYEFYGAFFRACDGLLRSGGRMLLQTITVPDERFDAYRRGFDFIRKYIFPGGLLASVNAIRKTVHEQTRLHVEWMRNIGPFYAPTLHAWRGRFMDRLPEVRRLGFDDRFIRMWEFYLACCEAQFACRSIGDVQMLLVKRA